MPLRQSWDRVLEIFYDISRAVDRSYNIITRRSQRLWRTPTHSWGRSDYDYWRRVYYCKVPGLELSGLFLRPIVNKIAAWVLGRPPNFQLKHKPSQVELEDWWEDNHATILRAYRAALKQGDSFIVINSDLTLTIVPPDTVDPIVSEEDYSQQIGWRIHQVFPHPDDGTKKMIVTDEYYEDYRFTRTVFSDGRTIERNYPNLIGFIPVVHIANLPGDGEEFGHPEAEALVELLHRYGQTLEAAVEGNILQGRPTPVLSFDTVQDLNAFWRRYGKRESTTLPDGTVQETDTLSIDMSDILTVSGARFSYESPGTFAEDTERLLGLLFYLILEHIELPEFVFGNAIQGSKASAETQMPIFEIFVRMRQKDCTPWIMQIAQIVLAYLALLKPGLRSEKPTLQWAKLTQNGRLTLDSVNWAYGEGLLDERTALLLLPVDIEKPEEILKQAKKDARKRKAEALKDQERQLQLTAGQQNQDGDMDPSLQTDINSLDI